MRALSDLPALTPLRREALTAAGLPPEWGFGLRDQVRFHELDALGHVNNAVFLSWFETFRLPYLEDYGVSDYSENAPRLVLATVSASFEREMLMGEIYVVTGRTAWYRSSSFGMEFAVFAPDRRATGSATVVLRTRDGTGKWPLTQAQKATFRDRDGAEDRA
ncbi:MAG: acyl-CoA thioesterase [Pseudomonadota bacterium]